MKVTLISFDQDLYCCGIRILSSCLKRVGHQVQCLFMPTSLSGIDEKSECRFKFSQRLLRGIGDLCAQSDLVGMSLMTNQYLQAVELTGYLKREQGDLPIIWGGIQPTVEPAECLRHADMICVGEGEDSLLELCDLMGRGMDFRPVRGMFFRSENGVIKNPLRPLRQDLDDLPLPDYSFEEHYIVLEDAVEEMTRMGLVNYRGKRFYKDEDSIRYPIMTSRGCVFSCTYCCNDFYKKAYPKQKRLRWRGVDNVISEIKMIRDNIAPISLVHFVDDNFTSQPLHNLEVFCDVYKKEVGIPFSCQVSPMTIDCKRMEMLLDAGCSWVTMGVETATKRVAEIYGRGRFHPVLNKALAVVERYRDRMPMPPSYQFIVDNPYETLQEQIETLKLAISVQRPWRGPVYSLMFFPGTSLYERAMQDGHITDKCRQIYARDWQEQSRPLFAFWLRLYRANFSPMILRLLLKSFIVKMLTSSFVERIWRKRPFSWTWRYKSV